MGAPIDLQQHPFLAIAFSAGAVLASPSMVVAWTRDSRFSQEAPHRGSGHRELFPFGQQLGEMLLIDTRVLGLGQRHDAAPLALLDPLR